MIRTENGNAQMDFAEFLRELSKVCASPDEKSAMEAYRSIADGYVIASMEEITPESMPNQYRRAQSYLKEEARPLYRFLYANLSYDCGPLDFCPQDCPYEIIYVHEDGDTMTMAQVMEILRKRKG